ncbi:MULTISPECIES: SOS response-associated peptidase [unclassified Mesorhizobium]|uniref:SOS response-associated peptidase n=1 Tax=unclassified Mesorhizobium TaxID=325217 RepID=UPI0033359B9C
MTGKRPALSAHNGEGPASNFAGLKAPTQLCHLNIAAAAPYDDAAIVERCVGIENPRAHGRANITGTRSRTGRCLIVADGFYEFTDPEDPKKKRKDKWLFTKKEEPIFCIAGIWRETPEVGEAFTMLTMEPGPDIVPYHDRQIVILDRSAWADWLDPSVSAKSLIKPLPPGTLQVEQVG